MCLSVQKAIFLVSLRRDNRNLSGVDDHGTFDIDMLRQLGRSYRSSRNFFFRGVWCTSDTKQGNQMLDRKSDGCVVPMKSGNADGGKAPTSYCPQ
jgi:hypothetical protein